MDNNFKQVTTQIRNFYSDSCYMNMSFFNTNLSFRFYPAMPQKDSMGRNSYDMKNGLTTTIDAEYAYALFKTIDDVLTNKVQECVLNIPCAGNATLSFKREQVPTGEIASFLVINKNNMTLAYRFPVTTITVKENGVVVNKTIESSLGAVQKTIDGYLTGINADRHLDKLTEAYVKSIQQNNQNGQNNQSKDNQYNNGYRNNNKYNNKKWNNNYSNNKSNYQQQQQWSNPQPQQKDLSSYNIQN